MGSAGRASYESRRAGEGNGKARIANAMRAGINAAAHELSRGQILRARPKRPKFRGESL
jgi:hypothetical protein